MIKSSRNREYDRILRHRDFVELNNKARASDYDYFMQIRLEHEKVWLGLSEPIENGLDSMWVLYFKMRVSDERTIFACVDKWKNRPRPHEISESIGMLSIDGSGSLSQETYDLIRSAESKSFILKTPNPRPPKNDDSRFISMDFS